MIRIYCDSNVFRILMPTHPKNKTELNSMFEELADKFIFCFSDAHLDDLKESERVYVNRDLEFMGRYVKDNYYSYDHIKEKRFECFLATPIEAFENKDYVASKRALLNPFDFEYLLKEFGDFESPELKAISGIMKSYFDIPISAFGVSKDTSSMDEKTKEWIDLIIPGYHPLMSLNELMKSITPFGVGLLQDEKKVSELRKYIREFMNRDVYSFEKWGLEFNEKFKETGFSKTFLEIIDSMLTENQKNDFYLKFTYAYTMLEIYNITQEKKSKGGLKKFNYDSLSRDAHHAYYASFCDYLVSDDNGVLVKANIVYKLFGFQTKVLSTQDFLNMRTQLIGQEETTDKFIKSIEFDVNHSLQLFEKIDIETGDKVNTYKLNHDYFNYFNRLQINYSNQITTFAFYCERNSHGNFVMYRETELIVRKLIEVFDMDDEGKGLYSLNESSIFEKNEKIRKWTKGNIEIFLVDSEKSRGNFLCLCFNLVKNNSINY